MNYVPIQYIGPKEFKGDNVAGTDLVWSQNEVHLVHPSLADHFLKHPTVWRRARKAPKGALVGDMPDGAAQPLQPEPAPLIDTRVADKTALIHFANQHFDIALDQAKPVEDLRVEVQRLIASAG